MAQILKQVVGHKGPIELLLTSWKHKRLPHALLFSGIQGIGKKRVALGPTQHLICLKQNACGECTECKKVVLAAEALQKEQVLQSESLHIVTPQNHQIRVEAAREILSFLQLQKWAVARCIIVDDAHLLNIQAANLLLKTLEEPPQDTYFVFISHQPSSLPMTIRSRLQKFHFAPLMKKDMQNLNILPKEKDETVLQALELVAQMRQADSVFTRYDSWSELRQLSWNRDNYSEFLQEWAKDLKEEGLSNGASPELLDFSYTLLTEQADLARNIDKAISLDHLLSQWESGSYASRRMD